MKVRYTELAGASGSRGGSVSARNRGGNYMRQRVTPVNPRTANQIGARARLGALSAAWRDALDDAQRTAWQAYADSLSLTDPLGQAIRLTGLNAYVRGNSLRLQAGLARLDTAPTDTGSATFTPDVEGITCTEAQCTIPYAAGDSWASAAGGALLVYISDPVSPARNYPVPVRFEGLAVRGVGSPPNPIVVNVGPINALSDGQRRFVKISTVDPQGRISQDVTVPVRITA